MRKSPFKHEVHTHSRITPTTHRKVKVRTYKRGEGKPPTPQIFKHVSTTKDRRGFGATLNYTDGSSESSNVEGKEFRTALPKTVGYAKKQLRSVTLDSVEVK